MLLFFKAHIKGYTKRDGTYVAPHESKVQAKTHTFKLTSSLFKNDGYYPDALNHPRPDDEGKPFQINNPSKPTPATTWSDPASVALFVPDGATPTVLNGVALAPWHDVPSTHEAWANVPGQMHDLNEPDMQASGKEPSAGVIIEELDGRVWIVRPSNEFGGYSATYPKGRADEDMSFQATAIKEAFEETGLQVRITGFVGDVERTKTMTRYYRACRVGGTPANMGWETQAVALVPRSQVHDYVNRDVDRNVADKAGIKRMQRA